VKTAALLSLFATMFATAHRSPVEVMDTYPRQAGIDVQHYVFRLALSDGTDQITGKATIQFRVVAGGVRELALDLTSVNAGKGMTVSEVTSPSGPVSFTHTGDRLRITFPTAPAVGALLSVVVAYQGVPGSGLRIGTNKYGERTFFSLNWPDKARQWLPMIDHPYDKASNEFIVTAPAKYRVVANGLLQEEIDLGDGRRETHWKNSVPIASWLDAIGVAQFATRHFGSVRGVPLQDWVYHQDRDNGIATFETPTRQAIEFFTEHIGPYPYEKLANVQAAGLGGGTEHASVIFYGEASVTPRPATNLVAHEIAHQWFGNAVTERDWDDVWLSEGFATYFTLLFTEHYSGREAFVAGLVRSRGTVFTTEQRSPGKAVIHNNLADMSQVLNQLVYQKGGWVLHMLRGQIGTDNFWAGIRTYYTAYRDKNASTQDLRRIMEEQSGQDLGWFFGQWLERPGSPVVDGKWIYDAETKAIEVTLTQTQGGEPYRLPLEIGITVPGAPAMTVEKVELRQRQQKFSISVSSAPTAVLLDPNTWVLMNAAFSRR
jgi:aminopeptidase N